MSTNIPQTKIKLSDITGPYPLLGLFLLIIESFLGFWLFRADVAMERLVAGTLMALLLGGFLFVVLRMQKESISAPDPQGLPGKVTAATESATQQEIEEPEPDKIPGPDGTYIIDRPPAAWIIRALTMTDFLAERMQLDPSIIKNLQQGKQQAQKPEVLVLKSQTDTSVVPIPGKTTIDGRIFPSAFTLTIPIQLSILPMERYTPPFFVERPLLHNFMAFTGQVLAQGLTTFRDLRSGIMSNTQMKYWMAEFRQEIKNATVNRKAGLGVVSNIVAIGIEGELKDHLLILNYPSLTEGTDPQLDRNLLDLQSLSSSFKPLVSVNPIQKKEEIKKDIDDRFKRFIEENKQKIFYSELFMVALRFNDLDMDQPEKRNDAIKLLRPFQISAKELNLHNDDLEKLWVALSEAEKGDATNFKSLFSELRESAINTIKKEEELQTKESPELPSEDKEG